MEADPVEASSVELQGWRAAYGPARGIPRASESALVRPFPTHSDRRCERTPAWKHRSFQDGRISFGAAIVARRAGPFGAIAVREVANVKAAQIAPVA